MTPAIRRVAGIRGGQWTELEVSPHTSDRAEHQLIRIAASDLREARSKTTRIRAQAHSEGRTALVFLDVSYHVADDVRTARREAAQLENTHDIGSVSYVGTSAGLYGLIDDIMAADVADGVTLLPLSPPVDSLQA